MTTTTLARPGVTRLLADSPFTGTPEAVPGLGKFQTVIGYASWVAAGLCLIGLIVAGTMMAVSYQRGASEHTGRLGGVVAGCLLVGGASTLIGALLGFNLFTSSPQAIPGLGKFQTVISYVAWTAAGLCLVGMIAAGTLLAVSYQRGTNEHTHRLGGVIAGCLLVGGASTIVGALI